MNKKYSNKKQLKVIDKYLKPALINNDLSIKNIIIEYLSDKCIRCDKKVINPPIEKTGGKIICMKCIHFFRYCFEKDCSQLEYINKYEWDSMCKKCYAWRCSKHKEIICSCGKDP